MVTASTSRSDPHQVRRLIKKSAAKLAGRERGPDRGVRRNSYDVDDARAQVWTPINGGTKVGGLRWRDALLKTAREYDLVGKKPGKRGPLTPYGIRVLEELLQLVDFATGRLDPTIARLMARTGYAKRTVVAALARLQAHGFLQWVRRSRKTQGKDGPIRKQTSNAYYFEPGALPRRVWRRFKDLLSRADARARAYVDAPPPGPPPAPPPPAMPRDAGLADALARLGASLGMSPSS